jgi:flagellar motor protein MotB
MGKAAKAHRAKVLKRNQERKHVEKKMKKEWEAAFEEQMTKMKEQFASMSGMSEMSGISEMLGMSEMLGELTTETEETALNEVSEDTTEPNGSVQGE